MFIQLNAEYKKDTVWSCSKNAEDYDYDIGFAISGENEVGNDDEEMGRANPWSEINTLYLLFTDFLLKFASTLIRIDPIDST